MKLSVDECRVAMEKDDIDDNTLVRMFRACLYPIELVRCAIGCNNERAVRLLIAAKFDLSDVDYSRRTFIHHAYQYASRRIVDMLVAAGVDPLNEDFADAPPWHYAASNPDETVMAHLIASGIDVNAANSDDFTLAHRAAHNNKNENVLAMLIAAGADVTTLDMEGNTICHFAAVLAMLIPLCDVNATNNRGDTPCISATFRANPVVFQLLIDAGANVHAVNHFGKSVLNEALSGERDEILEILADANVDINVVNDDGATLMHVAAHGGNLRLLRKLIDAGGNVNARRRDLSTPCHVIFQRCNQHGTLLGDEAAEEAFQLLSLLLAANADVHAKDRHNNTPLHVAIRCGFYNCVALLLSNGADAHARSEDGLTPLLCAQDARIVALLIAANADVNAIDNKGLNACHRACAHSPVLAQLLDAGANPLVRSRRGLTPLHYAAKEKGTIDAIPLLIRANADVNECDNDGNSAGHRAARFGCVENLKLLIAHGAQINQRNNDGKTMLYLAALASANALEMMRLLIDSGADTSVIDDRVAFSANPSVFPLLCSFGVNLNAVDVDGNTPCHMAACDRQKLVALFALGATMTVVNNDGKTPYDVVLAQDDDSFDEEVVTFVAAGHGFGVKRWLQCAGIAAIVTAGGGIVSMSAMGADLLRHERSALWRIEEEQMDLFRARAFQVCVGLQWLRLSALELCEILTNMFAPLESLVPMHFAWRVVCAVKHFHK
jgi:ankyrin repeat protein